MKIVVQNKLKYKHIAKVRASGNWVDITPEKFKDLLTGGSWGIYSEAKQL